MTAPCTARQAWSPCSPPPTPGTQVRELDRRQTGATLRHAAPLWNVPPITPFEVRAIFKDTEWLKCLQLLPLRLHSPSPFSFSSVVLEARKYLGITAHTVLCVFSSTDCRGIIEWLWTNLLTLGVMCNSSECLCVYLWEGDTIMPIFQMRKLKPREGN